MWATNQPSAAETKEIKYIDSSLAALAQNDTSKANDTSKVIANFWDATLESEAGANQSEHEEAAKDGGEGSAAFDLRGFRDADRHQQNHPEGEQVEGCLLYTSDAAD